MHSAALVGGGGGECDVEKEERTRVERRKRKRGRKARSWREKKERSIATHTYIEMPNEVAGGACTSTTERRPIGIGSY